MHVKAEPVVAKTRARSKVRVRFGVGVRRASRVGVPRGAASSPRQAGAGCTETTLGRFALNLPVRRLFTGSG